MQTTFRWLTAFVIACGMVWCAAAQELKCDLCGQVLHGKYFIIDDHGNGGKKNFCRTCSELDERCFICGMPVNRDAKKLADGRYLCNRDAQQAIESEAAAKQICDGVRNDLDRMYSRFLTMPGDNVVLSLVDKFHLESLFKSPGYEHSCVSIFGATQSQPLPGRKFVHSISILSDLKRSRLMAVCAHEYTHAWMGENVRPERKAVLSPDTVEGFCELVSFRYMESQHEEFEMQVIRTSDYTRGQIAVLLEAENRYGFNAVVEWIKAGEDNHLDPNNIDRVRAVQNSPATVASTYPSAFTATAAYVAPPAPASPTALTLKAISGTSQQPFALINDGTFENMERGRVRLGDKSVIIRCLEIRKKSVVIQKEGSTEKIELFLGDH